MRTTLKIVLPLIISVAVISLLFAAYQVRTDRRILRNDLSRRAEILGESLQDNVEPMLDKAGDKNLQRLVDRFGQREHLKGVAVYGIDGKVLAITPGLPAVFRSEPASAVHAAQKDAGFGEFIKVEHLPMHAYALPLHNNGKPAGVLALFHDTTYIETQVSHTLRDALLNSPDSNVADHAASDDPGALDVYESAGADGQVAAHAAYRAIAHATDFAGRGNIRSAAPRGDAPGAGFERGAGFGGKRSAAAGHQCFAVDVGAAAGEPAK